MLSPKIDELLTEIESSGEAAAVAVSDHLRKTAQGEEDSALVENLRDEAENLIVWASAFLDKTRP